MVGWWGGGVGWGGGLFDYSVYSWPKFCQSCYRGEMFKLPALKSLVVGWWGGGVGWGGGLFDYSVYSWPRFCQDQG